MADFKDLYFQLRSKEQRIYTDNEVALLPEISSSHIYFTEWEIRKESSNRLLNYLHKKKKPLSILEVGCGNGWLSAKIADVPGAKVTSIDTNTLELQQAQKVFTGKNNLTFKENLIEEEIKAENKYDIVVFAASIQYFSSLKKVIEQALSLLNDDGEIHILDTHFYKEADIEPAKERTKQYFEKMGFPEMAIFYHHHSLSQLRPFGYKILYNPNTLINKIKWQKNPFYWIKIRKE